jgi:putative endopeptidase
MREFMKKNRKFVGSILVALAGFAPAAGRLGAQGINVSWMDRSINPCTDFYEYANGTWRANNPIPADRASWGSGAELQERNRKVLHEIAEAAAQDTKAPKGSPEQMVGAFYRSGMDEKRVEADGREPLKAELGRIEAINDRDGLTAEIAHLHRLGVNPAFGFFVLQDFKDSTQMIGWLYQGGLGLPDRDYYFKDDDKTKEIRDKYLVHAAKMLELLGDSPEAAAAEAKTIMEMETRLAKVSMTPVEQRDPKAIYHPMRLAELDTLTPGYSWTRYFNDIELPDPGLMSVSQPEFFKVEAKMVQETSLSDWKTYLRWNLVSSAAPYLSSPFVEEDFNFTFRVIRGTKELEPRWKRVLTAVDNGIGEALGQLFVARAFPPEAKARALELVKNLEWSLRERIKALDWIQDPTRQQALKKLEAIAIKIGYPDKWRDYSTLTIDDGSYYGNVSRANDFEFQRNLNKIGKPVDRTEWGMTPPTVNAYYNPNYNEIVFPAGILQPPFFDAKADDASNYGGIGAVIGHELTHGFDDQGRQFDEAGNMRDWWTEQDAKNYEARALAVEKQFDGYVPIENIHINGKLTLGENIADLGGVKIAYNAMEKALEGKPRQKIDGFTPEQRFFIAFAQIWKNNIRPEAMRLQLATNPHSPARYRVVGPTSNLPEFTKAFGCGKSQAAKKGERAQVQIW